MRFQVLQQDGGARLGRLETSHGAVETPLFMPVGTQATVKGLTPEQLRDAGAQILLGNTYHLTLRPGEDVVAELGGLHQFMGWDGPILTDSGGYQIYSLALNRRIDDRSVVFRSHLDGALVELTPERATTIQEQLGADIAMCLDECPAAPPPSLPSPHGWGRVGVGGEVAEAVRRTIHWAERCRTTHRRTDQALFAIVQGGTDLILREACAKALIDMDFPGYALGGFSVGETPDEMLAILGPAAGMLPKDRPRYLMGIGRPSDILAAVASGVDMFDCVLPTRNGRNASAFTQAGPIRLRNACHKRDSRPIESGCLCYACRHFSRAYLHHLFSANEMLGPILLSLHNVAFYCRLMKDVRSAVRDQRYAEFHAVSLAQWSVTS